MNPSWLDKKEYPFTSRFLEIKGHRLHYIDEGEGDVLLFVHGTPSWSFDFRHVIQKLSGSFRCIAIDHIGFGLSDKPPEYDYSTFTHSQTLRQFVEELRLELFTLVVHDFGGPIGLHMAIRMPHRIHKIVMLNSWMWSSENDPDYLRLRKILKSPLLPFLYRYLNFSVKYILPASFGDHKLPRRILKQYAMPFRERNSREGTIAFARSLVDDQDWFQSLWEDRQSLAEKPVLLIWGMKDPVIKPHYLERFVEGFPHTKVIRLERSGHFPQEEEPEKVAMAIRLFQDYDHV